MSHNKWAATREKGSSDFQSNQAFSAHARSLSENFGCSFLLAYRLRKRTTKVLARLCGCADSPEPLLFAYAITATCLVLYWSPPFACRLRERTALVLAKLLWCAGSPEPWLFTYARTTLFPRCGSNYIIADVHIKGQTSHRFSFGLRLRYSPSTSLYFSNLLAISKILEQTARKADLNLRWHV